MGGLYVSTLYSPVEVCRLMPSNIGYFKCGEKFALDKKCFNCNDVQLDIIDLIKKEKSGMVLQHKSCFGGVESYEVDLPEDVAPIEKLMIISEIFMNVFLNWDEGGNNEMILTKKRKFLPGLGANFMWLLLILGYFFILIFFMEKRKK